MRLIPLSGGCPTYGPIYVLVQSSSDTERIFVSGSVTLLGFRFFLATGPLALTDFNRSEARRVG